MFVGRNCRRYIFLENPFLGSGGQNNRSMRRLIAIVTLATLLAVMAFVASGDDTHPHYKGVVMSREATTVLNYSYLVFTNTNNFAVSVSYIVENGQQGLITLQSKESKKSYVACADNLKVDMQVKLMKDGNKAKRKTADKK